MRVQYLCMNKYIPLVSCDSNLFTSLHCLLKCLLVDICWVHTAVGSEFSLLWSMESGLFDVVSTICTKARPNSRRLVLWFGVSDANHPLLWLKTLSRWAADHEAWWALSLTLRLANRASLCWTLSAARQSLSRWFLRLSLSLLLSSDSISESYIQLLSGFQT